MSKYAPRHGAAPKSRASSASAVLKRPVVGAGVAVALIASAGAAVATGEPLASDSSSEVTLAGRGSPAGDRVAALNTTDTVSAGPGHDSASAQRVASERRNTEASRSAARDKAKAELAAKRKKASQAKRIAAAKKKAAAEKKQAAADRRIKHMQDKPEAYAIEIMRDAGFGDDQWGCLKSLWIGESNFTWDATNPTSGAYGIPQALPAEKMATAGEDWRTNPETQMRWGIKYIKDAYGSPCQAYQFWSDNNPHWY